MNLKLISANIRFDNANDGIHIWKNRLPLLKNIIADYFPDILATQEGREPQIKSLDRELPLTLIDSHRQWLSDRMYPCLFINQERLQVISAGDIWLSETPYIEGSASFKSAFPRLCTWAHLHFLHNHQEYFVVNTHLDHVLEETRVEQIKVLLKEVATKNHQNLPVILMGDFNTSPKSIVRKLVVDQFDIKDPWHEKQLEEQTSHHGFKGASSDGDRIDWILVPNSFAIDEIKMETRHFDEIFPSDHFPLLATVIPR